MKKTIGRFFILWDDGDMNVVTHLSNVVSATSDDSRLFRNMKAQTKRASAALPINSLLLQYLESQGEGPRAIHSSKYFLRGVNTKVWNDDCFNRIFSHLTL